MTHRDLAAPVRQGGVERTFERAITKPRAEQAALGVPRVAVRASASVELLRSLRVVEQLRELAHLRIFGRPMS